MGWKPAIGLLMGLALLAGCSGGDGDATTTTTSTTAPSATTVAPAAATTTSTTAAPGPGGTGEFTIPDYDVVERVDGEDGAVVVVQLDPASFESLSEIDLENVIVDLVDRFAPVYEAHVVDSAAAASLVLLEELTPEQEALLAEHYFVRFEDGFRIVYLNDFAYAGESILGS